MAVVKKVRKGGVSFSSRETGSQRDGALPTNRSITRKLLEEKISPILTSSNFQPIELGMPLGAQEIETSRDIDKLLAAFVDFREECPVMRKDKAGYNYSYVSLANIIENVSPILTKNGLCIIQFPISDGSVCTTDMNQVGEDATTRNVTNTRGLGVLTILSHRSGQYIRSRFTMPAPSLQGSNFTQEAGACITYARRYAISAVLCIAADEDTDADYERTPKEHTERRKKRK